MKYRRPDGSEASESGFESKKAALTWGRDQEGDIRQGRWTDAAAGKATVAEWIHRWASLQDVALSTEMNRKHLLASFILPAWGSRSLNSLTTEEITHWESKLPAQKHISPRTAQMARGLLSTILGDATTTRPPLIPFNPALRQRNRGRKTGRRMSQSPQRAWASPLEVLLVAERAALLSGSDEDFVFLITLAYTGMRWAEATGLEQDYLLLSLVNVEWQLHEINGIFHRLPPKDDSYRSTDWAPHLPVDLPPFLSDLLSQHVMTHAGQQCSCVPVHGGSGRYVFLAAEGGHHRRSNYSRRVFRPAVDGRHRPAGKDRHGRIVIADTTQWPGVPAAAWPPAEPEVPFTLPRGKGIRKFSDDTPLSCWLVIRPGLTPHGLRHSHKTWMTEDGIPEIVQALRLGHTVPGMRGVYTHVSDTMRAELKRALQARWEASLRDGAAISPRSPVPLLDGLLAPNRATREKMISQIPPNSAQEVTQRLG
ncbi:MAG: tyrosine-type recombinase/integrase [Streptosporangiaceae bacterium]